MFKVLYYIIQKNGTGFGYAAADYDHLRIRYRRKDRKGFPQIASEPLGNPDGRRGMEIMRRLAGAGVVMNCQIVCCRGLNDGAALERTMAELGELYPQVNSVSIVPVGLTEHRERLYKLEPFTPDAAAAVIDAAERAGESCLEKLGSRVFFCSDEFYLAARRALPDYDFYEDFPQLENGVGMLRLLEREILDVLDYTGPEEGTGEPFVVATGVSAAPFIKKLMLTAAEKCDNIKGNVVAVVNDFFGHTINVAGLITGRDLTAQLQGRDLGERVLIPQNMLRHGEGVFLDDMTLAQAEALLGVPVVPVEQDGAALLRAMLGER